MATTEAEVTAIVAQVWEALLGMRPRDTSDFFAEGGHSLLAARFAAKLVKQLNIEVDLALVFSTPRFDDLCAAVARLVKADDASANSDSGAAPADLVAVPGNTPEDQASIRNSLPVLPGQRSVIQKRLAAEREGRATSPFTLPTLLISLPDHVTMAEVQGTLTELVSHHPGLRMIFCNDQTAQVRPASEVQVELPQINVADKSEMAGLGRALAEKPFALDQTPRLRAAVAITRTQRALLLCLDHLIADQYAARLLVGELKECMEQATFTAQAGEGSHVDMLSRTAEDLNTLDGERLGETLEYWRSTLGGQVLPRTSLVDLPTFQPSNAKPSVTAELDLTRDVWNRITYGAQHAATTPFAVLMAAIWHFAQSQGVQEYLVTPVSNRRTETASELVTFLSHSVVRSPPALGTSADGIVAHARTLLQDSAPHEWIPHATLVESLAPKLFGRIRTYPWLVVDLDQEPWPEGVEEIEESGWNNTIIRLQFSLTSSSLSLKCTAASDVMSETEAADLVAGVAASLRDILETIEAGTVR